MKTGKKREHNINFAPYAENGIEFCYKFLDEINNNPEINSNINKWIDYIFGVNQFNANSKEFFCNLIIPLLKGLILNK